MSQLRCPLPIPGVRYPERHANHRIGRPARRADSEPHRVSETAGPLFSEPSKETGVFAIDLLDRVPKLLLPSPAASRRHDENIAVGGDLQLGVFVDAEGFEKRLVEDEGERVSGASQLLDHRTDNIAVWYVRSSEGRF